MVDDCIIMTPIDVINTFDSIASYASVKFNAGLNRYGAIFVRQRNAETKSALGEITAITPAYISVKLMVYDRFKSNRLQSQGISRNTETLSSHKSNVRFYSDCTTDIVAGDFILVGYNSGTGNYTEKYRVIESEVHEIAGSPIFKTHYTLRESI